MTTGYTAIIERGCSFEEFVWRCARGMGALITMRDDSLETPVPARFTAETSYYEVDLKKYHDALRRLEAMTDEEAEHASRVEQDLIVDQLRAMDAEHHRIQALYRDMRTKVADWTPPTKEHVGLKEFMLQQIDLCLDRGPWRHEPPRMLSGPEWRDREMVKVQKNIAYSDQAIADELERTADRNKWLADLRQSFASGVK